MYVLSHRCFEDALLCECIPRYRSNASTSTGISVFCEVCRVTSPNGRAKSRCDVSSCIPQCTYRPRARGQHWRHRPGTPRARRTLGGSCSSFITEMFDKWSPNRRRTFSVTATTASVLAGHQNGTAWTIPTDAAACHPFPMTICLFGALCTVEYAGEKVGGGIGSQLAPTAINSAVTHVILETVPMAGLADKAAVMHSCHRKRPTSSIAENSVLQNLPRRRARA